MKYPEFSNGKILYKCRLCEKIITGSNVFSNEEMKSFLNDFINITQSGSVHKCDNSKIGYADFVGFSEI